MKKSLGCRILQNLCLFIGGVMITCGIIIASAERAEAACVDQGCSGQPAGCSGGGCSGKDASGLDCGCGGAKANCSCR